MPLGEAAFPRGYKDYMGIATEFAFVIPRYGKEGLSGDPDRIGISLGPHFDRPTHDVGCRVITLAEFSSWNREIGHAYFMVGQPYIDVDNSYPWDELARQVDEQTSRPDFWPPPTDGTSAHSFLFRLQIPGRCDINKGGDFDRRSDTVPPLVRLVDDWLHEGVNVFEMAPARGRKPFGMRRSPLIHNARFSYDNYG